MIPARYASSRLPGKPLLDIDGRPLLAHVYERALASGADEIVIATDDQRIADVAAALGANVAMTASTLPSGTDRIAAALAARTVPDDRIVVNLQGDEPQMPAAVIRQVAADVAAGDCDMATVCEALSPEQVFDPNVVKVVRDQAGRALYFSRAAIPWHRDAYAGSQRQVSAPQAYRRHVGLYGYTAGFLRRFVALEPAPLEELEALEQLRALYHGAVIRVPDACAPCGTGVDTAADLARLRGA